MPDQVFRTTSNRSFADWMTYFATSDDFCSLKITRNGNAWFKIEFDDDHAGTMEFSQAEITLTGDEGFQQYALRFIHAEG